MPLTKDQIDFIRTHAYLLNTAQIKQATGISLASIQRCRVRLNLTLTKQQAYDLKVYKTLDPDTIRRIKYNQRVRKSQFMRDKRQQIKLTSKNT